MLNQTWRKQLEHNLQAATRPAILGIGNPLFADDGLGVEILRALRARLPDSPAYLLIEAGSVPENVLGLLRPFQPTLVILIDAAQMDTAPGALRWLEDWTQTDGLSASSHTLPFLALARYLQAEYACEVALLGIQPSSIDFGQPSPQGRAIIAEVVEVLAGLLTAKL